MDSLFTPITLIDSLIMPRLSIPLNGFTLLALLAQTLLAAVPFNSIEWIPNLFAISLAFSATSCLSIPLNGFYSSFSLRKDSLSRLSIPLNGFLFYYRTMGGCVPACSFNSIEWILIDSNDNLYGIAAKTTFQFH